METPITQQQPKKVMNKAKRRVHWEVEVHTSEGMAYGDYQVEHERRKDAIAEAERIAPFWLAHKWNGVAKVVRVEKTEIWTAK